jgi:hypothetical protein
MPAVQLHKTVGSNRVDVEGRDRRQETRYKYRLEGSENWQYNITIPYPLSLYLQLNRKLKIIIMVSNYKQMAY